MRTQTHPSTTKHWSATWYGDRPQTLLIAVFAIVFFIFTGIGVAKEKVLCWQVAIPIDTETTSRITHVNPAGNLRYRNTYTYAFKTERYLYEASMSPRFRRKARIIINEPIKIAINKDDLYLIDKEGKRHKLTIQKQVSLVDGGK